MLKALLQASPGTLDCHSPVHYRIRCCLEKCSLRFAHHVQPIQCLSERELVRYIDHYSKVQILSSLLPTYYLCHENNVQYRQDVNIMISQSCSLPWFHLGLKALRHLHQLERVDLLHSDKDSSSQIWNTSWFWVTVVCTTQVQENSTSCDPKMNVFLRVGHILKLHF